MRNPGLEVHRAALDIELSWVPTIENKGEGIFIAVRSLRMSRQLTENSFSEVLMLI